VRTRWLWVKNNWKKLPHPIRWVVASTIGFTLVGLGLIFMVLPGPGIPLVIAGLAILATEFAWAEIVLNRTKHHATKLVNKVRKKS
jgi:uncharacterized protein (TIGR02611 family)